MIVKQTSIDTFRRVTETGVVKGLQAYVYKWVFDHQDDPRYGGKISQDDMAAAHSDVDQVKYARRFSELVQRGLLEVVGKKLNRRNNEAVAYRTADNPPMEADQGSKIRAAAKRSLLAARDAVIRAGLSPEMSISGLLGQINLAERPEETPAQPQKKREPGVQLGMFK